MHTLGTSYQRPHPRVITRSCPFLVSFRDHRPHGTTHLRRAVEGLLHQGRASSGGYSLIAGVTPFAKPLVRKAPTRSLHVLGDVLPQEWKRRQVA